MPAQRHVQAGTRPSDEAACTRVRREVGLRLREHRHRAGLTQTEVAAALDVSLSAVSMWEQGNREVGYENLLRLASLYGASVGSFFEPEQSPASAQLGLLEARVNSLEQAIRELRR